MEQRSEIPRNTHREQFSAAWKRLWQSSALVSPTKTLNTNLVPIGDDIEPIEAPREDVEKGNEEYEEPLEAEIPSARMNPKNPTSREKQGHEDSGCAVCRNLCAACVEGPGVGGQHQLELLEEEGRERRTPTLAFDYGFMSQEHGEPQSVLYQLRSHRFLVHSCTHDVLVAPTLLMTSHFNATRANVSCKAQTGISISSHFGTKYFRSFCWKLCLRQVILVLFRIPHVVSPCEAHQLVYTCSIRLRRLLAVGLADRGGQC